MNVHTLKWALSPGVHTEIWVFRQQVFIQGRRQVFIHCSDTSLRETARDPKISDAATDCAEGYRVVT